MLRKRRGAASQGRPPGLTRRRFAGLLAVVVLVVVAVGAVAKVALAPDPEPTRIIPHASTVAPPRQTPDERATEGEAKGKAKDEVEGETKDEAGGAGGCLSTDRVAAQRVTKVAGAVPTYRLAIVPDGNTYDLRGAKIVGYSTSSRYPLLLGKRRPGRATCVLGGTIAGRQSRDLTGRP